MQISVNSIRSGSSSSSRLTAVIGSIVGIVSSVTASVCQQIMALKVTQMTHCMNFFLRQLLYIFLSSCCGFATHKFGGTSPLAAPLSLQCGADLHMAQLMPLPLTVSCFSKIQIGFTFLVPVKALKALKAHTYYIIFGRPKIM